MISKQKSFKEKIEIKNYDNVICICYKNINLDEDKIKNELIEQINELKKQTDQHII